MRRGRGQLSPPEIVDYLRSLPSLWARRSAAWLRPPGRERRDDREVPVEDARALPEPHVVVIVERIGDPDYPYERRAEPALRALGSVAELGLTLSTLGRISLSVGGSVVGARAINGSQALGSWCCIRTNVVVNPSRSQNRRAKSFVSTIYGRHTRRVPKNRTRVLRERAGHGAWTERSVRRPWQDMPTNGTIGRAGVTQSRS